MRLTDVREDIPALEDTVYLNTGASGPSPRRVVEAAESALEHQEYTAPAAEGPYQAAIDVYEESRAAIAGLLETAPERIALTQSTTDAVNRVAGAIDWTEGDVVVRTDLEHPAGVLPWRRLERERGLEVCILETENGRIDLEDVKALAREATLFCVSSLTWTHGTRLPIAELVEIAHDAGAMVLVDAVQSPGQVAVDVGEWGADFVAGAGHKWLLGPFGAGFLYVREGVEADCSPSAIGYRSVTEPTAAEYEYEPGAQRFEVGTTSPAPHAGLTEAIAVHQAVGLEATQDRIETLTDRLKDGIDDERLLSPRAYESGLVTIADPDPEGTVERLATAGIVVRSLPFPQAVRASVHAVNTPEEVDALLEAL